MMQAHATAATVHGRRYMTQLAKHWGHKFEVTFDERQARIVLPIGVCIMAAGEADLVVTAEADDEATLTRLEGVIASHLARFSFREPDMVLDWRKDAPAV